jgi:cell division protein FtsL
MIENFNQNNKLKWWEKLIVIMIVILILLIIFLIFNEQIINAIQKFKLWYSNG